MHLVPHPDCLIPTGETSLPPFHPVSIFSREFKRLCTSQGVLKRCDFRPVDYLPLLPWLAILEPLKDQAKHMDDFRYRLFGTGLADLNGEDYTGRALSSVICPQTFSRHFVDLTSAMHDRIPIVRGGSVDAPGRSFISVYRGFFPVSSGNGLPDQIFLIMARVGFQCREYMRQPRLVRTFPKEA